MTGWRRRALCAHPSVSPQDFSPVDRAGRLNEAKARSVATHLCGQCSVRDHCLADALAARADGPAPCGRGPQEQVRAGFWWPVEKAKDTDPIDLLDHTARRAEGAAA